MSWPGFVGDPSSEVWVWVRGGQSGHHHQRQPSAMGLRPPTPAENKSSGIEEPLRYYSIVSFGRCLYLHFFARIFILFRLLWALRHNGCAAQQRISLQGS